MPGTVELGDDGCWTFRIDYSTNHWQTWDQCPRGDDLVETGGQSWQRWMIGPTAITNLSDFTCADGAMRIPADPAPDEVSERTMSGAQVGTERSEVWFVAASGLPVSNERTVEARTDTPIGESTYTETGEFHLVSVDPD